MATYAIHDLYRNTNGGMQCPKTWPFSWPGSCLTAQSVVFPPHLLASMDVQYVLWRLCWNPNVNRGSASTAVRLVAAENGPSNLREIGAFYRANYTQPLNDGVDITQAVRDLIADALTREVALQFIHQSCGDSVVGPIIYSSALEVVYA